MVITDKYRAALKAALSDSNVFVDASLRDELATLYPSTLSSYQDIQSFYAKVQTQLHQWQYQQAPSVDLITRFTALIGDPKKAKKVVSNQAMLKACDQQSKKITLINTLFVMGIVALTVTTLVGGLFLWLAFRKNVTDRNKQRPKFKLLAIDVQQHTDQQVELQFAPLKALESLLKTEKNVDDAFINVKKDVVQHIASYFPPNDFRAMRHVSRLFKRACDELTTVPPRAYMRHVIPRLVDSEFNRTPDIIQIDDRHRLVQKANNTCVVCRNDNQEYTLGQSANMDYEVVLLTAGHFVVIRHDKDAKLWYFKTSNTDLKEEDSFILNLGTFRNPGVVVLRLAQVYLESNLQHLLLVITSPIVNGRQPQSVYLPLTLNANSKEVGSVQPVAPDQLDHTLQYYRNNQLHAWSRIEFTHTPYHPEPKIHFHLNLAALTMHKKLDLIIDFNAENIHITEAGMVVTGYFDERPHDPNRNQIETYLAVAVVSYQHGNKWSVTRSYKNAQCIISPDKKVLAISYYLTEKLHGPYDDLEEYLDDRKLQLIDTGSGQVLITLKDPRQNDLPVKYNDAQRFTDNGNLLLMGNDKKYHLDFMRRKPRINKQPTGEPVEEVVNSHQFQP